MFLYDKLVLTQADTILVIADRQCLPNVHYDMVFKSTFSDHSTTPWFSTGNQHLRCRVIDKPNGTVVAFHSRLFYQVL